MENQETGIFETYTTEELTQNLEQLLYGWLCYASETGMKTLRSRQNAYPSDVIDAIMF